MVPLTYAAAVTEALGEGPYFHGTKADLQVSGLLTAGFRSNYRPDVMVNGVYFTTLPNVTDKKFPGNPTRSYRSSAPLRVAGEVADWTRQTPEAPRAWRDRLADERNEIVN